LQPGRNSIRLDMLPGIYFLELTDGVGKRVVDKVVRM